MPRAATLGWARRYVFAQRLKGPLGKLAWIASTLAGGAMTTDAQ